MPVGKRPVGVVENSKGMFNTMLLMVCKARFSLNYFIHMLLWKRA